MHRNIHPQSIVIKDTKGIKSIQITGFSLATRVDDPILQTTYCGTAGYIAPEIANYSESASKYD